ncbi:MAG: HEPN domain-containing protein [bacterium]
MNDHLEWLKIAKSNLNLGKSHCKLIDENIRFEEFCYELQQCVEKSLKALLIFKKIEFPKTHSIEKLIDLLQKNGVSLPKNLLVSAKLTDYAIETRYPDDYTEITEEEYKEAVEIAEAVYKWIIDLFI